MTDLIIKNGKTVDGNLLSVAMEAGKIKAVSSELNGEADRIIDLKGDYYISAGWIDSHVHCDDDMPIYYDQPDEIGVTKGVTTIIDAGSTGADTIKAFYDHAKHAKTNVYALINISKTGIIAQNELADMEKVQQDAAIEAVTELPQFIVGLKARMSKTVVGDNGYKPLEVAKNLQSKLGDLPLMVHIGSNPPTLSEVLSRLDERDILTHCFNGKENGILDQETKTIKAQAIEAYKRGVRFDVGHGTDSFNFETARYAKQAYLKPHTISTDIYHKNRESGPVYDLATTMEKLLVTGYSLAEIIPMVTQNAAEQFNLSKKGHLRVGFDADITIFKTAEGSKKLVDSNGNEQTTQKLIQPICAIVGGNVYDNGYLSKI
ncbi:dihydroorotase [Listeria floridensis FSL S10-1187]|uniref:Dihydroorotase n=1 Tax=Listeria floridensis FSL S10-1187 TaxID=1265817 RepID=A0ABP3B2L8_9LIST|nr:amidohydrolase/deacetylase family metallohydrolase [Listeria floridensis]EUJ33420.1 dihydroorotase [Listeria floridensis FSL S10-1187]